MHKSKLVLTFVTIVAILSFTFTSAAAQAGQPDNGIIEPNPVIGDPHAISPFSYIYTKYPTFIFTQYETKTKYRVLVYKADKVTLYYKYKGTAYCYLSECTLTPDIALTGLHGYNTTGIYYWRVEVKMDDGTWFGPPDLMQFALLKSSFNSDFNLHRKKWSDVKGLWELASGAYLKNTGVVGEYTSATYQGYIFGDFVYEAKIKLKSKHTYTGMEMDRQAGGIIVIGHPYEFFGKQIWHQGIYILIRNDQKARIFEYVPDGYVDELDTGWVSFPAINPDDWNTIKVVKVGPNLLVKINDVDWMTYTDPVEDLLYWNGFVGLTHFRYADESEKMLVDWAKYEKISPPLGE